MRLGVLWNSFRIKIYHSNIKLTESEIQGTKWGNKKVFFWYNIVLKCCSTTYCQKPNLNLTKHNEYLFYHIPLQTNMLRTKGFLEQQEKRLS